MCNSTLTVILFYRTKYSFYFPILNVSKKVQECLENDKVTNSNSKFKCVILIFKYIYRNFKYRIPVSVILVGYFMDITSLYLDNIHITR